MTHLNHFNIILGLKQQNDFEINWVYVLQQHSLFIHSISFILIALLNRDQFFFAIQSVNMSHFLYHYNTDYCCGTIAEKCIKRFVDYCSLIYYNATILWPTKEWRQFCTSTYITNIHHAIKTNFGEPVAYSLAG